jgi:hypothetical protein
MKAQCTKFCVTVFAILAIPSTAAEELAGAPPVIRAFDCTSPCEGITLYNADGAPVRKVPVPEVGPNGIKGDRHGTAFIRIMLYGNEVYISRMDVRLAKDLAAPNPGKPICKPQVGTMGSGC